MHKQKIKETKQRKNLKKSTFCGPQRSFPCNDCAHVVAAKRMLNRSKFSDSTKAKIRACINRKEKSLGCGGAKKEKSAFTDQEIQTLIDSEIFASTLALIEEAEKNPGMELTFTEE
jgi:hypothetical protein